MRTYCVRKIAVLLAKDTIEPVPPAEIKSGLYSPYFIVPNKSGGLRPILDLRTESRIHRIHIHRMLFKMFTQRSIF